MTSMRRNHARMLSKQPVKYIFSKNCEGLMQSTARVKRNQQLDRMVKSQSLPTSAKTADSLNSFKRLIQLETTKIPTYYNTGSRQLQMLHARLRTECSSLNEHLFQKSSALPKIVHVAWLSATVIIFSPAKI